MCKGALHSFSTPHPGCSCSSRVPPLLGEKKNLAAPMLSEKQRQLVEVRYCDGILTQWVGKWVWKEFKPRPIILQRSFLLGEKEKKKKKTIGDMSRQCSKAIQGIWIQRKKMEQIIPTAQNCHWATFKQNNFIGLGLQWKVHHRFKCKNPYKNTVC